MDFRTKKAFFDEVKREPLAKKLGMRLVDVDEGYARVEVRFTPDLENLFGMAHGGAIFALIDEAFEIASNSHGTLAVALSMSVTYLSSPTPESLLMAEAKEVHQTQKTSLYEIKVFDEKNRLIASCQALAYKKGIPHPFLKSENE
ncbi:MAG: PaaI family thioesterase [Desulfobacterota bacterium]|nr:PaaI family thioesterase [Thermodesulfobacteriota bacterium]